MSLLPLSSYTESDPQYVGVCERGEQNMITRTNFFWDDPFSIKSPASKTFLVLGINGLKDTKIGMSYQK